MQNKVTIFTPYYNSTQYLESYLSLVSGNMLDIIGISRGFIDVNLIMDINLPSPEDKEIIAKYSDDPRIKFLVSENKLYNWSESANRCIREVEDGYVTLWGVDDIRYSLPLISQILCLDNNPDIAAVAGDFFIIDGKDNLVENISHRQIWEKEHKKGMLFGPFFMFRKSVVDNIGMFDEQLVSGGDYDFCMRMVREYDTFHLPICLGAYRNAGIGNSTNPNSKQPIERTVIEKRYALPILEPKYLSNISNYDIYKRKQGDAFIPIEQASPCGAA